MELDGEGLIELALTVAAHRNQDRLAGLAGGEGQLAGKGLVVAARQGRPVGGVVIDPHGLGAGTAQTHPHLGVLGTGIALDECDVTHRERRHYAPVFERFNGKPPGSRSPMSRAEPRPWNWRTGWPEFQRVE